MSDPELKCEFLKDETCLSVSSNEEVKEARKIGCNNDNENACCYLCFYYQGCEISCAYLGKNNRKTKRKTVVVDRKQTNILRCPQCDLKMLYNEINLRIGGWSGVLKGGLDLISRDLGQIGEIGEELLPVLIYVCPKCGKIEFRAQEKAKERIIDNSLGTFLH